jgi:ABC-type Fe3+/spermidine/putrescine transport system ATPase subunit
MAVTPSSHLRLERVTKRFGGIAAVADLELDVERGELVSLLGPSGCGKTTTLRLVAGLLAPDGGDIWLDGRRITDLPSYERDMGMVFQTGALFPNMTAVDNVAFPLKVRGVPAAERRQRVDELVGLVGLTGLEGRYPHQLSGGQQQRVGIGRALAGAPRLLLLDEPLSALDAPIRRGLIVELRGLQQTLGITTLYVTHDQEEALGMSDRVAVMERGRVVEVGTPEQLYAAPASPFTAAFVGAANLWVGEVVDTPRSVRVAGMVVRASDLGGARPGQRVRVSIHPEALRLAPKGPGGDGPSWQPWIRGRVTVRTFQGATTRMEFVAGDLHARVDVPAADAGVLVGLAEVWLGVAGEVRVIEVLGAARP